MGPSGSGKTTLLNALSGRVRCEGSVWLGERPLSRKLRHLVGYSTQHDLFHPHLRLRQMLQFTAELRLPHAMSQAQKVAAVDAVIDLLGLQHCQDTTPTTSLSTHSLPQEPTSGLDAHAAHSLIANLKALAVQEGRAVVLSLHQPSSRIFHMLDTVLLLAKGQPAYLGPSGDVAPYMAQLGLPIQPNYNPADFLLEVATEYSERLIRHYSETHRAGNVVRQSKNPPPWVFHQRLSSLSASQSKPILGTDVDDDDASSSHERLDV
ncbi:ABC transporter G family member 14-like, partial [Hyalella azteca]|uniref:ABC transporter G family member 14-like n=1 Tax=Hyalella azteca TaxID=294128 RepID=A0A979FVK0_HYAAZ